MTTFSTGSLVKWKRGHVPGAGYGIVASFERMSTPLIPNIDGAWVHWPDREDLMWAGLSSLEVLVQITGSM